jgi:hypothetical protein
MLERAALERRLKTVVFRSLAANESVDTGAAASEQT